MYELEREIDKRVAALSKKDWQELERLYKRVTNHKGSFYKVGGKRLSKHVVEMPYAIEAPVVKDVRKFFYDKNLVVGFDWGNWEEGRAMFQKTGKDRFNYLTLSEVIKLFTAIIRNDRFCEGAWAQLFERGDAAKLLKWLLYYKDERYPHAADLAIENLRLTKPKPEYTASPEEIAEAEKAILDNPNEKDAK